MKLWRFECKPNYPITGGLILFVCDGSAEDAIKKVEELAPELNLRYYEDDVSLEYIGDFTPFLDLYLDCVLTFENGEY